VIAAALKAFGEKYPIQWLLWGNRFRRGLADGSRVMLAYQLNPAKPSLSPLTPDHDDPIHQAGDEEARGSAPTGTLFLG